MYELNVSAKKLLANIFIIIFGNVSKKFKYFFTFSRVRTLNTLPDKKDIGNIE